MYDDLYDTESVIAPCEEPAESSLRQGLDWDDGNLSHIGDLTRGQIEAGITVGYFFLKKDSINCRFRYLFQPEPSFDAFILSQMPVYRLIIDTSKGTLRPVTVFVETNVSNQKLYIKAKSKRRLE